MSKEMWIAAHERAIEETLEADPNLSWEDAYNSEAVAKRADVLCAERQSRQHGRRGNWCLCSDVRAGPSA